ncbi:YggT family protein [Natribacillus halophilus]|uniref:YggT family protein n=1 Tax=Natribacillus halophilus TaxID=549003 RepID=A0A1G8MFG0_9BACI|nr:YggT family protein [Natribacillus halophilus]SDI66703.1 YggT family protein [Natribacillus halophilus]
MHMIGQMLMMGLNLYSFAVLIYVLSSWIPNLRESNFGQMLGTIVEPYLEPFRKIIPSIGMIDISPIVAIIALQFASTGVAAIFF